ncbi:TIGR03621 family F420-dependent LLM class oxidoreductase [Catenulispora pinisilvae]|uniref:TIGR03621 family F420-dependent LLM class oxidoreductase n=1 Tax=Catenulispora pinisilvae TaxID=2705253 RepID=UPI00189135BB|nr:TIGR03621 family F420-dependent LLM class oxidoreductase [Catenulispora pinisilvae]
MHPRTFRFAVVAALAPTAQAWQGLARQAENLGYSTLLAPDTMNTLEPFTALAAAATATETLRVGTFVLPAPFYPPSEIVWRALALDLLSGGRLDLGLGAGRPDAEAEVVHRERRFGTPAERVKQLSDALHIVKEEMAAAANGHSPLKPAQRPHPPILVAAAGHKMFQLAAAEADIITLGLPPGTTEDGLAAKVAELRTIAGTRFDDLELNYNIAGVGTDLPAFLSREMGIDPEELIRNGAPSILTGTTQEMADKLRRRRDELGISYIAVNGMFLEKLAPVVELLAGT